MFDLSATKLPLFTVTPTFVSNPDSVIIQPDGVCGDGVVGVLSLCIFNTHLLMHTYPVIYVVNNKKDCSKLI